MSPTGPHFSLLVSLLQMETMVHTDDSTLNLVAFIRSRPKPDCASPYDGCHYNDDIYCQEYLESLHELHEDWLVRQTRFSCAAPVLVSLIHLLGFYATTVVVNVH